MAHRFSEARFDSGDIATPRELNEEIRAIVSEINGNLDRSNVEYLAITQAKLAGGCFHEYFFIEEDVSENLDLQSNGGWSVVPDISFGWAAGFAGVFEIESDVCIQITSGGSDLSRIVLGLRINGEVLAIGDAIQAMTTRYVTLSVIGMIQMPAGNVMIEPVVRVWPPSEAEHVGVFSDRRCMMRLGKA